tara:strand:- start:938 stop:1873 length:936 start_codon:yes stop_codon:yes gene_type:complete
MEENKQIIYLNKAGESWITDRFRHEWYEHNKNTTRYLKRSNIIWIISPWTWNKLNKKKLKLTKTVCTIHHIDETKLDVNYIKDFENRDQFVDIYHVPSSKTKKQLIKITSKPIVQIPFWVDSKKFYEIKEKNILRSKYGFKENDYIVGSFQRDTEGHDLKSPKLSKGPDLFINNLIKLKKSKNNLKVLISGYRRQYVIEALKNLKIEYTYFEKPNIKVLNELYNCLDLYIVASRVEGGPMAVLECATTKTPIISTDVGIASQILHPSSIYDLDQFENALPNIDHAFNQSKNFVISNGMKPFNKMMNSLYES